MGIFTTVLLIAILTSVAHPEALALIASGVDQPLVSLSVLDEETGAPVERFLVVPGVPYSGTDERSVASWQPHLVRESAGGRYEWPQERSYETFRLRVEADGYRPSTTAWLRRADGPREVTLRLRRDPGIRGIVLSPDGSPAAGATIGVALPNRALCLSGRTIDHAGESPAGTLVDRWRQPITTRADAGGQFRLTTETDPAALLVVVHKAGYLERPFADLLGKGAKPTSSAVLRLAPWGRIAGHVLWGDRPGADEHIELIVSRETLYPDMVGTIARVRSDAGGRFDFKDIPPGRAQLSRRVPTEDGKGLTSYQFPVMHVDVLPGDRTEVVLGGRGRVVAGRLTGLDSYKGVTLRVHPTAPHVGFPGDDAEWQGWTALRNSPLGASVFRDAIPAGEDGTFRIEGLVPESYQLMVDDGARRLCGGTELTVKTAAGDGDAQRDLVEIRVTGGTQ
jgi:hypothetical protein